MTLKEKLSLSRIEHFALALEKQPSVTKLLLLHDEERIEQVKIIIFVSVVVCVNINVLI